MPHTLITQRTGGMHAMYWLAAWQPAASTATAYRLLLALSMKADSRQQADSDEPPVLVSAYRTIQVTIAGWQTLISTVLPVIIN